MEHEYYRFASDKAEEWMLQADSLKILRFDELICLDSLEKESILFFAQGSGFFLEGEMWKGYAQNYSLLIGKKKTLQLKALQATEVHLLSLRALHPDLSKKLFQAESQCLVCAQSEAQHMRKIERYAQNSGDDCYQLSSDIYALLMLLCARLKRPGVTYSALVQAALEQMNSDYFILEGMGELADRLAVSKEHLNRKFKEEVGLPPGRYLQNLRIDNAKLLLLNRAYSIENIANMVGYSGANYFTKVFSKQEGESPGEYRKRRHPSFSRKDAALLERLENYFQI